MQIKRSQINAAIAQAKITFAQHHLALPPFAFWTTQEWDEKGSEVDEIRDCMLGWDVTDFGSGDFDVVGRTLFTLRNGKIGDPRYPKGYAEKFLFDPELQRAPAHFHRSKREDIICRGGGNILVQLTRATPDDKCSDESFAVQVDGQPLRLDAGGIVRLQPGMSVCIPPRTIHQFWGEERTGLTVSCEVSSVCDDLSDNFFLAPMTRFPAIDEDEPRQFYLCNEYPRAFGAQASPKNP